MEDLQTMLQLQLSGQFNGQDTRVTISIDSEQAFDIQDMDVGQATTQATDQEAVADADAPSVSTHAEEPEQTEAAEEAESDEETITISTEDLPPMTAGTKQYKVGKAVMDHGDTWVPAREILESVVDEYDEDDWNNSIVTSHIHSLMKKNIFERQKNDELGVYEYRVTDVGQATLDHAERQGED